MPSLSSFSALNSRVRKYREDYELEADGEAFSWVALELLRGLNVDKIIETIVDQAADGGIDALEIINGEVHFYTFTYTNVIENVDSNFPQNKLDSLAITVGQIFEKKLTESDVNPALWDKVKEIWNQLDEGPLNIHLHVCSNKLEPLDHAKRRFEGELETHRFVTFHYYDLESLVDLLLKQRTRPVNGRVQFLGRSHFAKDDGPLHATVAAVPASDLVELIKDPDDPDKISDHIFDDNVRVDLGLKNAINRGIYESALSGDNFEFWYLNNGVTIVCDTCEYHPTAVTATAELTNVQIVNGGQTSRTLFHASQKDQDKVADVDVLLKIIATRDRTISTKISETANRQTPVRTRDLHANDAIQKELEEQFRDLDFYYERKKNQHVDQPTVKRIDAELAGQIAMAYYLDLPSQARNQKALVYGDYYSEIVNETLTTADWLLKPYLLYRPIEKLKREIQKKKVKKIKVPEEGAYISLGTFHILNTMKLVAEQETLDLTDTSQAHAARSKATSLIFSVVKSVMKERGELYTHDRFFKQKETNELIRSHVAQHYSAD